MGQAKRIQPEFLAQKLRQIRESLGLSQPEIAVKLSNQKYQVRPQHVSDFELGKSEPNLMTLLRYARLVGISTDDLIDDRQKLKSFRITKNS
ncbi:MAG TPA: helix-turn-helix transcriptional regulator [Blastocatellia bacterium]|nr:helix-turn-helix transcriptional regulator [Blastocatellia bacterium]